VSTVKHPRSVQAARVIEEDKKVLAEMLFVEIPPRRAGRTPAGVQTIEDELRETAAEILEGTGKQYDWGTLNDFRKVAAWVAGPNWGVNTPIRWADASWTAHLEAYKKGVPWAEFVAGKRTKRAVREQAGASTGDVPAAARAINQQPGEAAKLVDGMTPEARKAVFEALDDADAKARGLATEADPGTERLMRRMDNERDAWDESANHGAARGGEHEVLATLEIQWLHEYGHQDSLRRLLNLIMGLLDLEQADELTPEMFNE
jgi:hypothetical protein